MSKKQRSGIVRALNAVCAMVLVVAGLYVVIAGFQIAAVVALVCATAGVATPVLLSGEGILEVVSGIFGALLDGLMAVFEAILDIFSGIFG